MDIRAIEALKEEEVKAMATDTMNIKEHNVYFADLGEYFGFSALVFAEGQHIYYANDYQLHHGNITETETLKKYYIKKMNDILYTEEEIKMPSFSYAESENKRHYLQSYYGMRRPHVSAFYISKGKEEDAKREKELEKLHYNPVCFAYYEDQEFIKKCIKLFLDYTKAEKTRKSDSKYWEDAFLQEMFNHEYSINNQADYDVVSVFANVDNVKDYWDRAKLFKAAKFSKMQITAYNNAVKKYYEMGGNH